MPAISFLISLLVRLLVLFLLSSLRQEILVKVSDIGVDSAIKTNYCGTFACLGTVSHQLSLLKSQTKNKLLSALLF